MVEALCHRGSVAIITLSLGLSSDPEVVGGQLNSLYTNIGAVGQRRYCPQTMEIGR